MIGTKKATTLTGCRFRMINKLFKKLLTEYAFKQNEVAVKVYVFA